MLRLRLRGFRNASKPSRAFDRRLRQELCLNAPVVWPRLVGFSLASFLLFFGTGMGAYAYASPEVTDAHPLYGLKRGMEQMQGVMQFSDDAQAQFHAQLMERRLQEAEVLMRLRMVQEAHLEMITQEMEASLESIQAEQQNAHTQLFERLEFQRERMEFLKGQMQTRLHNRQ